MSIERYDYAAAILSALGLHHGWRHLGAKRALVAWMGAESGWLLPCNGVPTQGANFNPLNTTLVAPGSTFYNHLSADLGVQNYPHAAVGAMAVADTLLHTPGQNYEPIVSALAKPFGHAIDVLAAVGNSKWGTFHNPDGTYDAANAAAILETYQRDRASFNVVLVGA